MRTETMDLIVEGAREAFTTYPKSVVESAIKGWFSDVRYCLSPDTELKPLTFAEHLELACERAEKEKEKEEHNKMMREAWASLTDTDRAYGVSIDSFGNKTKRLSLGT